jgi:ATP-dependent DNA helicase RecG
MKSYDHITFENNYTKEEFIVTVIRQEIPEDSVYDGVYDSVYDEKILAFCLIPKNRKEIMDLIGLTTHSKNYERYIVPLLEKGLLSMTLPDKPKSKNQKYITIKREEVTSSINQ